MTGVMLVHDDAVRSLEILQAFAQLPEYEVVNHVKSRSECVLLLAKSRASVLVIRPRLSDGSGIELALQIRQNRPGVHIVLALDGDEGADVWTDLLKHGFRVVLTPPYSPQSVLQALHDVAQALPPEQMAAGAIGAGPGAGPKGFVLAVGAARGGSGRSLVAVNLALAAAQRGKRVILLDFAAHPSDFSMMLDDIPRHTVEDLLANAGQVDLELLESVLATHPKGLRYLASPSHDFETRAFSDGFAGDVLALAQAQADLVVVDTSEALPGPSMAAFARANAVLLLTSREVVRLDATRRFIVHLAESGVDSAAIKVFVNHTELGAEVSDREVEAILETAVAGYLPHDGEGAIFSVNSGRPLVLYEPKRPLSVVLQRVADLALARWSEPGAEAPAPGARSRGWFRKG